MSMFPRLQSAVGEDISRRRNGCSWRISMSLGLLFCFGTSIASAGPEDDLPEYSPGKQVSGVIRVAGTPQMENLLLSWQKEFRKIYPGVWFENTLKGNGSGQFALHVNAADIAVSGRQVFPYEYYGIYRRSQLYTTEIAVATGSYDKTSKSTALAIFVHKDNPLAGLTLEQLDGIFGAQREGGWQKTEWITEVARGPEKNIRTWGQLGLTGEWADKPIRVYGPPGLYPGGVSYFQTRVMGGADTWNESLQEYPDRKEMLRKMSEDRYGIAYAGLANGTSVTRTVPLAENAASGFVPLTRKNIASRAYPLSRFVYFYLPPDTPVGDPVDPETKPEVTQFIKFILSRRGQKLVEKEGDYLPLTKQALEEQQAVLDQRGQES